ncbi:MAG TPA: FAD-binding oxidoreductase, partial [Anseongella sp.]
TPLIGIEPSAILTFRDEYPDLVDDDQLEDARRLAANSLLIDEFLLREIRSHRIRREQFTKERRVIKFHGHCQQKAAKAATCSEEILSFPLNYQVEVIPSGCCGMAGSFGYEKEHYDLSMKIADLVLLPEIKQAPKDAIIASTGTSCRHQILDGAGQRAFHPVEVLYQALATR